MAENSKIEWCDHTFNPWIGCTKISPACDNCYAEEWDKLYNGGKHWGPKAPRRRTSEANWKKPLKWNKDAEARGVRYKVFCASLADVFDNQVDHQWRDDLFNLIKITPHLDWLLLTKRPQNIRKMLPEDWRSGYENVWLGTTVENQEVAEKNIPYLLDIPAKVRFLSCEPLLEHINLTPYVQSLNWVICGGESGSMARQLQPEWAQSLRDQCIEAGTPFFFKQWGLYLPVDQYTNEPLRTSTEVSGKHYKLGKASGRTLDGRIWDQYP